MEGLNDTAENLMAAIERDESEVSPSTLYGAACVLEGVPYINGAPQNTFVPGLIELAVRRRRRSLHVEPVMTCAAGESPSLSFVHGPGALEGKK